MITKLTASGPEALPFTWEFSLQNDTFTTAPLVAGDRLICTTGGIVFALDLYTGQEIKGGGFPYKLKPSFDPIPLTAHSRGTLYLYNDNSLIARQLSDGKEPLKWYDGKRVARWKAPRLSRVNSVRGNDSVIVITQANPDTIVTGINAADGTTLWEPVTVTQDSPGPITATSDVILFAAEGKLFAVNIRSGDTRFTFKPEGDQMALSAAPRAASVGDKDIVVASGTAVYAVDLSNGKQLWVHKASKPSPNTQWLTPVISERYNRVVLANTDGEVFVLELSTGTPKWTTTVKGVDQLSIPGDKVYVTSIDGTPKLHVIELFTGKLLYSLNMDERSKWGMAVGHGILFTTSEKKIQAYKFAEQNAALFNGTSARITVPPDKFDFHETDFTVETWICTTKGGEIASSFPTVAGNDTHSFRINVTDQGRIRFAISNNDGNNSLLGLSALTNCADGSWHHVAVVRRTGVMEVYVDGTSVEVDKSRKGTKALDISGKNALSFGAFMSAPGAAPQSYFAGMMRDMRVWDIALDANKIQSRMLRVLNGKEPQLLAYWPMDDVDITRLQTVTVKDVRSFVTELSLDTSSFPYLLDQALLQWPYSGHWSARGEKVVSSGPSLDRSGIIAFGASNRIYGVHAPDGMRAWSKDTPGGASTPLAGGGKFFVNTPNQGMIAIDSTTGSAPVVVGFNGLMPTQLPAGTPMPAPATDGRYIAAASPDGNVWIVENTKTELEPGEQTWKWKAPAGISGDISSGSGRFYLIAGQTLYQLDPVTRTVTQVPVAAGARYLSAGDTLFCEQTKGTIAALSAKDLKPRASFSMPSGTSITGMCASPDADLLVVATQNGVLYGLTFATLKTRWTTSIPAGTAGTNNVLNVPVLENRTIFCTSNTGTVAAIDANTGEFRGLFFEPTQITTAPVIEGGTIYFGCADAPAEMRLLDGALHSVVFGRTNALRLNVDVKGARETKKGYASVTTGDLLELLGVDQSCVEVWVNTREGGDILWIGPTDESKFGLRLWLDKDGTIHYTCMDLPETANANWEKITGKASSNACDGKWHHIAVSRSGRKDLTIYFDGVALTTTVTLDTVAQPALPKGLKVFIGADGTGPAPANFFSGMMGEIRVWDTYMTATRISERMHNKLVGNEADLLAYWNFDTLNIHDGSRNGHEGKLEKADSSSGFWLTDLNFTHPSYPYLETKGKIIKQGEEGGSGDLANTIYELEILARKGDGTPLDGKKINLWYVRHKGETGPDKIKVSTSALSKDLSAVGPVHGEEESIEGTTDKAGKLTFKLTTSEPKHGPSLDVRPEFLPANERYHVNVLIDNQKLEKPAPPKLEALANLIQDYHYNTGDKVDHTRDRSTWRAVIAARDSDGRPRSGERMQLWATEHVEVEVDGRKYQINPNNYQSFTADEKGELSVAILADELKAPSLSVWAGFMHRDERYNIPLGEGANDKLSKVKPDELSEPAMRNWKENYNPETDGKPIVKKEYKPHAAKVSTAIQHVMSVTQEPQQRKIEAGLHTKRARLRVDRRNFSDMFAPPPTPSVDRVSAMRTLRHIEREIPLEPVSFKQRLNKTPGFENCVGFELVKTNGSFSLNPLKSVAEAEAIMKQKPVLAMATAPPSVGNIFDDIWNTIENAAEAVWREAQRIAVFVADQVKLVIEYADRAIEKVIETVNEAVDAVVHIIKMIEAFIEDVIRFLRMMFDWGAIIDAKKILKKLANDQMRAVRQITDKGQTDFMKIVTAAFASGSSGIVDVTKLPARSASSCRANDPHPEVRGQVNSVHGKYVNDKVDDHKSGVDFKVKPSINPTDTPVDAGDESKAMELSKSLSGALSDPLGVSFADMYQNVSDLVSGNMEAVFNRLLKSSLMDFNQIGKALDAAMASLNAPIEIPFLSQLYRWIAKEDLTMLDVMCLAMAIPTHVGYLIYTLVTTGEPHTFAEDAKKLGDYSLTAEDFYGEAPLVTSELVGDANVEYNRAMHWSYFVFYELYTFQSGFVKAAQIAKGGGEWKKTDALWIVPGMVINGLVSKTLLYTAGMKEEGWNTFDQAWNSTLYGTLVLLDLYTALDAFFLGDEVGTSTFDKIKDKGKQMTKIGISVLGAVLLGLRIDAWVNGKSLQSDWFQARDVLNAIAMMFTFDDTSYFVKAVGPENAVFVVAGETYVKVAAGCIHIAAISKA